MASFNNLNAECHPQSYHAEVFHRSLHDSYKKVAIKGKYCRMMQEDVTCNNIDKELACSLHHVRQYGCRLLKAQSSWNTPPKEGFLTPNRKSPAINVGRL